MLEVRNLGKFYELRKHWYLKKEKNLIFKDVNFSLNLKENLLICGESGVGKSTLGKILCFLQKPSFGEVIYKNLNLHDLNHEKQRLLRKEIQYVFQDQKQALNPYRKVKNLIKDGLLNFNLKNETLLLKLFENFKLKKELLEQKAFELSGGEAARIGLIRALVLKPKILIIDEIDANLDIKNIKNILKFLENFQKENEISYIFISHKEKFFENFLYKKIKL